MATRDYTTRRLGIIEALVNKLKDINGSGAFLSNVNENVSPRLKFWDEVLEPMGVGEMLIEVRY